MLGYLYLNCTRFGLQERLQRQGRRVKSVTCVLSIRLRSPNPTRASKLSVDYSFRFFLGIANPGTFGKLGIENRRDILVSPLVD